MPKQNTKSCVSVSGWYYVFVAFGLRDWKYIDVNKLQLYSECDKNIGFWLPVCF